MSYQTTTDRCQKPLSGIALGGIGSGWFEIRQDGGFYNWNIFNNRPVARGPHFDDDGMPVLFFLLRYEIEGQEPRIRLLELASSHGSAGMRTHEFPYIFPWLDGVDRVHYDATVPFARLRFEAGQMPLDVQLTAWSPFIPHDPKNSSLPLAYFDFKVLSTSRLPVRVSLLGTVRNQAGYDQESRLWSSTLLRGEGWDGFSLSAKGFDPAAGSAGHMGLLSLTPDSRLCVGWGHLHPFYEDFLRQPEIPQTHLDADHLNFARTPGGQRLASPDCFGSAGKSYDLLPGETLDHSFCFFWDFPNRYARLPGDKDGTAGYLEDALHIENTAPAGTAHREGHYYRNFLQDIETLTEYGASQHQALRQNTRAFHDAFYDSSLPEFVLDQVNSQLNTFRTSSWFTETGDFGLLEGISPSQSYAGLMTIDVAMYGAAATAALFPALDRSSLLAHLRLQNPDGSILHSINQNFRDPDPAEASGKRIDLPSQYAYMILRSGLATGDLAFLREVWPSVQRALDYVLRERDKNGDLLPDMEGIMCSYDNFPMYGVAPYVATQWLAAITAAAETAALLGDTVAESRYRDILQRGTATLEAATWNGSYYRLYANGDDHDEGCLSDQILGHWSCRAAGLPTFLAPDRVASALDAIMRMNYRPDQGLRNCQWPGDTFLHPVAARCWVDQANTCWTGVELAFAALLIYEDKLADGLKVIENVDRRYRHWGLYWDHQEFGGHYFRPMSAWSIIQACLGYSLCNGVATFAPKTDRHDCRLFFMTPDGYGHYTETSAEIEVTLLKGSLSATLVRIQKPAAPKTAWQLIEAPSGATLREVGAYFEISMPAERALTAQRKLRLLSTV